MRVMIDACVLYPTVMRDMLMGCAKADLFVPRWSPRILEEWARAVRKLGPGAEDIARGEIALLNASFPQASVAVQDSQLARFWLPDPDDIHVLAAAVIGSCDAILTVNAKDFPRDALRQEGLWRSDPDGFLCRLYDETPQVVAAVGAEVLDRANSMSPDPWTIRALMKKARLPKLGKRLTG